MNIYISRFTARTVENASKEVVHFKFVDNLCENMTSSAVIRA